MTQRPVAVRELDSFIDTVERHTAAIQEQQDEIAKLNTCSFFPGMQEAYLPGTKVVTFPENMQGAPLGATVVQSYYQEDTSRASGKVKRTFVLVLEFVVSLGDTLSFVGISEPYSEYEGSLNLSNASNFRHRILDAGGGGRAPARAGGGNGLVGDSRDPGNARDKELLKMLILRGALYAEISIGYHYLQYGPGTFFPIPVGGSAAGGRGSSSSCLQELLSQLMLVRCAPHIER